MDKPLFADVSHALHVSYLALAMPPRQKASFRNMLIHLIEGIDEPTAAQEKWLAELRGPAGMGDYDPDRLTMIEMRAQYAMITDAAKTRLTSPEYAAVLARYGHGPDKMAGCQRLAVYARRSCGLTALGLLTSLVVRHHLPRAQRDGYALRDLADKSKTSTYKVAQAAKWMEKNFRALEAKALERLEPSFVAHGLVPDRTTCDSAQAVVA